MHVKGTAGQRRLGKLAGRRLGRLAASLALPPPKAAGLSAQIVQ